MTAVAEQHPAGTLTAIVAANVRQLMGRQQVSQRNLCEWLHLTQGTVSKKCAGRVPFMLSEVEHLAAQFGVEPHVLLQSVMQTLPPLPECAARDSNPEPAGKGLPRRHLALVA